LKVTSGEHDRTTVSGRELDHAVERVFIVSIFTHIKSKSFKKSYEMKKLIL